MSDRGSTTDSRHPSCSGGSCTMGAKTRTDPWANGYRRSYTGSETSSIPGRTCCPLQTYEGVCDRPRRTPVELETGNFHLGSQSPDRREERTTHWNRGKGRVPHKRVDILLVVSYFIFLPHYPTVRTYDRCSVIFYFSGIQNIHSYTY